MRVEAYTLLFVGIEFYPIPSLAALVLDNANGFVFMLRLLRLLQIST